MEREVMIDLRLINLRVNSWKLIIIVLMFIPGMRFEGTTDDETCYNLECVDLANEVVANMMPTADPCQDFFEYACGNWTNNHNVDVGVRDLSVTDLMLNKIWMKVKSLLERKILDTDSEVVRKSKKLYQTCVDTEAIERTKFNRLKTILDNVGGWPMMYPPDMWDSSIPWEKIHYKLGRMAGEGALFNIAVGQHYQRRTDNTIYLDQPYGAFGLFGRLADAAKVDKYKQFVTNVVKKLVSSVQSGATEAAIESDINDVFALRVDLQKGLNMTLLRRSPSYSDFTIEGLQAAIPAPADASQVKTDWLSLIKGTFEILPSATITKDTAVVLTEHIFILGFPRKILRTPLRTLVNHIYLHFVEQHLIYLHEEMENLVDAITQEVRNVKPPNTPRWERCVRKHPMLHALSSMYVRWYFPQAQKTLVNQLVSDIKNALKSRIRQSTILEDSTKDEAVAKINNMRLVVGSPEWYRHYDDQLQRYYEGQVVGNDHLQNQLNYEQNEYRVSLGYYTGESNVPREDDYPIVPNAYYEISNLLALNAGQILPPFYHSKFPPVVNYAGLGTVIGHELGHAFDSHGRRYDRNGKRRQWWTPNSLSAYNRKLTCLVNQYDNYSVKELAHLQPPLMVDGDFTLDENIADTIGIQTSFKAYKRKVNGNEFIRPLKLPLSIDLDNTKLFFVMYANSFCEYHTKQNLERQVRSDTHTTPRIRVNAPLSNMPQFGDAFGCARGTPMNRIGKCKVF